MPITWCDLTNLCCITVTVMLVVLIFTITCCYIQSTHNSSSIVVKSIENIDKEKVSIWKNHTARTKR